MSQKGVPGGVAELQSDGAVPVAQVPFEEAIGKLAYVGESNATSYLQEKINDASRSNDVVRIRPGTYVCEGLQIPAKTSLEGWAGDGARFGATRPGDDTFGGVQLRRPQSSKGAQPIVNLAGAGAAIRGLTIDGRGMPGVGLRTEAFEGNIRAVRVIAVSDVGLEIARANNGVMRDIWVDNCGTDSSPAVRVRSVSGAGSASHTNNQDVYNMHIERSPETALSIGGTGEDGAQVQWLRFYGLHIESPEDSVDDPGNRLPLVRIFNVQGIDFIAPMIFGGPGYLIEHDQVNLVKPDAGGVRIMGGALVGQGERNASRGLVHLLAGDSFWLNGTSLSRYTEAAIQIADSYGPGAWVSPSTWDEGTEPLRDDRRRRKPFTIQGDQIVRGHVGSDGPPVTAEALGPSATRASVAGDDVKGVLEIQVSATPVADALAMVQFSRHYTSGPVVTMTPLSAAAAVAQAYVTASPEGFTVSCAQPPGASATLRFAYQVLA